MNYPPLQFQARNAIDVERNVAYLPNGAVELHQFRQGLFIVSLGLTVFESESSVGGEVSNLVRSNQRHVILRAQQFRQLIEKLHLLLVVVGTPHRGLEPRHLVRIELAHLRRARVVQNVQQRADQQRQHDQDRTKNDASHLTE